MSTFVFTSQLGGQSLAPILRGRYVASIDAVPTGAWATLAGMPAIPVGGLVLAVDVTEPIRIAVKSAALSGGAPVGGYNLIAGTRETLFLAQDDIVQIRTP